MDENSTDYVYLTDDKPLGSYSWKGGLNLLNIVLIGISNELPEYDDKYELHRLLSTILSMELSVNEKSAVCSLSQGILERGEAKGEAIGKAKGGDIGRAKEGAKFIFNMYEKGYHWNK